MARFNKVDPETATGKAKALLDGVQAKLGFVPNMMRIMATSPTVLEGYLNLNGVLAGGTLSAKMRELIALAVAEANDCEYCLAAHSAIGKIVGLPEEAILAGRHSSSTDAKTDAGLKFARAVVSQRGLVTDDQLIFVRNAGFSEGEIGEIIAEVALNVFTNYFNRAAQTDVDFPVVSR